jgi:predicted secreted hydrolase
MAHLAITTPEGHDAEERFARDALGLAGVTPAPFRAWLEDWTLEAAPGAGPAPFPATLSATVTLGGQRHRLTLTLGAPRGPVLQGASGLSLKSRETGSASYYYSYTRMAASLTLEPQGDRGAARRATGLAWFDREWSSGALAPEQVGWDWLALHLSSGHDLMLFRLRRADGSVSGVQEGTLVAPDGQSARLSPDAYRFEPLSGATWEGPRGGRWPVRWRLALPQLGIDDVVRAVQADQHNPLTVPYWEGMVCLERDGESCGYLEMTGYEPPTDARPRSVE